MGVKERMEAKWDEIEAVKKEREALFEDFEANKDKIGEFYYEVEIMKLQYMFLKRQQLSEADRTYPVVAESIDSVSSINETCIKVLQTQLINDGFKERLLREGLI